MSRKGKVLVAMSGGIDSTMAAVMLHQEGYEVIGMTMKTWDYASSGGSRRETGCCSLDSINDARAVAVAMNFPHYIIDIRPEFGGYVINNFISEYMAGRTPNPCVLCNTHIKWDVLLQRANQMECENIATGHYAKVRAESGRYVVSKGDDPLKDQSYVLWGLSQDSLSRSIFPLGGLEKTQVREMARSMGFSEMASKSESYEICFIPDNDYRGFLRRKVNGIGEKLDGGNFIDTGGNIIGTHKGYPFYTIGQRKGLGIALGEPRYVTCIDPETNTVTLGTESDLERTSVLVDGLNWIKYSHITDGTAAHIKIRYKDTGRMGTLYNDGEKVRAAFEVPAAGVAPGQSAVFYEGDDLLGGGIIAS